MDSSNRSTRHNMRDAWDIKAENEQWDAELERLRPCGHECDPYDPPEGCLCGQGNPARCRCDGA